VFLELVFKISTCENWSDIHINTLQEANLSQYVCMWFSYVRCSLELEWKVVL